MNGKIIAISDLHNDLNIIEYFVKKSIEENAWLFVAGDITKMEYGNLNKMLELLNKTKTLLIPGNNERFSFISKFVEKKENILLKDFDSFKLEGIKILTIPGNSNKNSLNYWDENEVYFKLKELTNNFTEKFDLILSHRPPLGILDGNDGSYCLRKLIDKIEFNFFICGHIHFLSGESVVYNNKIFLNPGKKGFLVDLSKNIYYKIIG